MIVAIIFVKAVGFGALAGICALVVASVGFIGKLFTEADPEVSEAVDFAEFYPRAAESYYRMESLRCRGKGVGVVVTPWNFPIAIPCGGITAAPSG